MSTPVNSLSRQGPSNGEIKITVQEYIEDLRKDKPLDTVTETNEISANNESLTSRPVSGTINRFTQLPPIKQLEAYILQGHQAENFLNVLPDIAEALASYSKEYPDQLKFVWDNLKPILIDVRKRNKLRGKHLPSISAPICPKKPYSWVNCHGDTIYDDYAWLTDKDDPEVLKYLEAENQYAETSLSHTKTLQKVLYKEFVSRLDENEESAKVTLADGWSYFSKKIPNAEYRLHCRVDKNGTEEIYLDENDLSKDQNIVGSDTSFFHVGFLRHTPDCVLIAFGIDTSGSERYTTYFKNMETNAILEDVLPDCYEDFEFGNEGQYAFYISIDDYERAYQLKRHKMGSTIEEDVLLYEETDEMFCLTMTKTCNKRYLIINTSAQVTSETRLIDLKQPFDSPRVLFPRRNKIQYVVEHHAYPMALQGTQGELGYFYILTNEKSKNNQLYRIPVPANDEWRLHFTDEISSEYVNKHKEIVVEARDFVLIEAFQVRARHLIVFERSNCMQNIRIVSLEPDSSFDNFHYVTFSDGLVYSIWPGSVDEEVADLSKSVSFDTNSIRFTYTSFTQPKQVIDYNMDNKTKTVVHEGRRFGPAFDSSLYVSKRLWTTGIDGTAVPISIVYRKDLLNIEGNPLLLHGYGAYGYSVNPIFSTTRLSLLDRGFIYAVAHVRGGGEMGQGWYTEGKLEKKTNTFMDFISCAEYLIKEGFTTSEKLAIYGRSAGGLLIGATVNLRPELFKAVLTEVPFVDVINTMFDSTIPWTAFEFEEWGNPVDKKIYNLMQTYCPYSNVIPGQLYPNMLIVGGMNDPRVAYFEPAKWTAKLRALGKWSGAKKQSELSDNSDLSNLEFLKSPTSEAEITSPNNLQAHDSDRMLLLKIQDAGHSGSGGQYSILEDLAFEYAFLISVLGAPFRPVPCGGESVNGADYEKYWNELEAEDYEEEIPDITPKPSTPLQIFSDFWKRRKASRLNSIKEQQKRVKIKDPKQKKQIHSRSSSLLGTGLGLILGRKPASESLIEETPEVENIDEKDIVEQGENFVEVPEVVSPEEDVVEGAEKNEDDVFDENGLVPKSKVKSKSPQSTPSGSKASLRLQLYPPEEESGRVQSSGKVYSFWSKFF